MTTPADRKRVSLKTRKLMRDFEDAAVALSWLGSKDAESHDAIREEYREARAAFVRHLLELEAKAEGNP